LAAKNQDFLKDLFANTEKDKRETQRQNIMTIINMLGSQLGNAVSNPKTMYNSVYFAAMMFGAFHLTRLSVTLL
jgi:hypothetical protein